MADINRVILVGRLTRDAELRYTNSGYAVSKFSVAINRRRKAGDQWEDEANFDVVLWGKQAEAINQYLVKGKQVGVDGELRQSRWEKDGQSRSRVEISAFNIQLLGGGRGGSEQRDDPSESPASNNNNNNEPAPSEFEDDIPF